MKQFHQLWLCTKKKSLYFFSDISVNPKPDLTGLVDIATNAAEFAKAFIEEPKVAFLSFSTSGSAVTPETKLVADATVEFNKVYQGTKAYWRSAIRCRS
ncbi:phosphate acyltransferase [Mycoplasmopsis bovis]|nr:phosphate acyltransferase [Mycoplasmopsis bovis]